jgi:acyl-coenzyme A synthetase/AMP-(fatty) acid ligase
MEPYEQVMRFQPPQHEWFVGGKLNATVNCIDRHVYSDKRNKAALLRRYLKAVEMGEDPGDLSTLAD